MSAVRQCSTGRQQRTECAMWVATSEDEHAVSVETQGPAKNGNSAVSL